MQVTHVKKGDLVQVMLGRERGKTGKILRVLNKSGRVLIEKMNLVKRHTRATGKSAGGIVEKEAPIASSNVLMYCDKCARGVRTKRMRSEAGFNRVCRRCGQPLEKR